MELLILVVYGLALTFIFLYSLNQFQLVFSYLKGKRNLLNQAEVKLPEELPMVTVQLPVYNEKYVVERLVRSVADLEYPAEKMEIQILDDSTDETSAIVQELLSRPEFDKLNIIHIQRENRTGFKAGALAEGLKTANGEFIAIFDADFIPNKDFILKTVGHFKSEQIGMVQARWDHLNRKFSLLTKLQAFGLDAHFSVEQGGRNAGNHFINFNGTAGIWRKKAIEDSGGWQADTLTEDLDLSYRAQLRGWKFKFLESCGAPAELPAEMNALKTQQYRWTKGAAECTRKNLPSLLRSKDFTLFTKVNGIFHLLNSSVFICIALTSLLSIPVLFIKHNSSDYQLLYQLASVFLLGVLFLVFFYFISYSRDSENRLKSIPGFLLNFPLFLSVSMGLSMHNGMAAIEGLIGKKSPFIRTPKFNIVHNSDSWKSKKYAVKKISGLTYIELLMSFYFAFGVGLSIYLQDYGLLPFLLMLTFGYMYVSFLSLKHALM